jgi:hypothetical protein
MSKTRLTLDLSPRHNAAVDEIADQRGTTKIEVLRLAIELFSVAISARSEGMIVGAWRTNSLSHREEREFIRIPTP